MTASDTDATVSPLEYVRRVLRQAWRDILSVYYANTPIWRLFKSVGLLFFGFFCWTASNLLFSYGVEWTVLEYVRAYGFVLILWGPLTHAVIVPLVIRLRRTADRSIVRTIARNGSKINLSVFLAIVLILGTAPISPMVLDFQPTLEGDSSADVNPDLSCTRAAGEITCELSESEGIDSVVVTSGGNEVTRTQDPPYDVTFREADLEEAVGQKEFIVELRDEDGETLRRYRRPVSSVSEADSSN
ncbi:hypothetical protein [Natrinema altunense]|uniref:Uncharacterized protein n=1 Tax=Natrinema altunense (strain JCM 12890 / CGMCC 1.3731 / AJ2) TaxID=1227494 RepID=L9ZQ94_NATA2|nr:hypothetical protein [Natrinema altunense]ELY88494.1 hypothetical protein C485_06035 [Natrinema altunense JCM 12890]